MAGNISNYLENKLLEHSVGKASFTMPTTTYCALYTVAPTDSSAGSEIYVQNGYSRKAITWGSASGGAISNTGSLVWTATGVFTSVNGGTTAEAIVAIGILDASSVGNLLWYGPLSASVTISNSGDTFTLAAAALTLTLD